MEVFKAASSQMQDSISAMETAAKQNARAPRSVEHAEIKTDVVKDKSNEEIQQDMTERIKESVEKLNENMERLETSVRFAYNDKIDILYVNVINSKNGEVIRQIPGEQAIKIAETFKELVGNLFDQKE